MPARLDRALQVRTADRLRASLARDDISGLPCVGALSDDVQHELCAVGGGRLAVVVIHMAWTIDASHAPRAIHQLQTLRIREVARLVNEHVRRTDLLGSLHSDALLILAPGLDHMSCESLAQRLRDVFAAGAIDVGNEQMPLRVRVGLGSRSAAAPAGWTIRMLAEEAERNALDPPPIASVA